jgi:predicted metal-binding membrane protein
MGDMDDMGTHTTLGSFASFASLWVVMMAAMMLPSAVPATVRQVQVDRRLRTAPLFVAPYLAVWALVGVAVFALYRPHDSVAAGSVVIAAGLYELTPIKRHFRERCLERTRSGIEFGYCCVASSIGLMAVLLALGVMNIAWMALVALAVLVQKLLPPKAALDIPFALAIVALGIATLAS